MGDDKPTDLPTLIGRLTKKIYEVSHWDDAVKQDIDALRQQFQLLEANEQFIIELVRSVWKVNMSVRKKGEVKRILLPVRSEVDKETLFGGYRVRGPAAYLKVRFHDRQEDNKEPICDGSTYYATMGLILVPANPPLIWMVNAMNEFTRQPVIYRSSSL